MLIKGMFPGLELTNDDAGVNVRPLPLLNIDEENIFYTPHTYHVDVRFEMGFTQPGVLADAVMEAKRRNRRVVVEHYELLYPYMHEKAGLCLFYTVREKLLSTHLYTKYKLLEGDCQEVLRNYFKSPFLNVS